MLGAHFVPGYFAAIKSRQDWKPQWNRSQRVVLWAVALGSTVAPDLDVIYNALFRGFFNHSTLWTHSLIPYLSIGIFWWLLGYSGKWRFLRTLMGLMAIGGLSHMLLNVIAHGTPLLFGSPSQRSCDAGGWTNMQTPGRYIERFRVVNEGLRLDY